MGDNTRSNWTEERIETLKKLWTDGLAASQIAAELGGITRNAVIGKTHRLGLPQRVVAPQPKPWIEARVHERTWQRWKRKAAQRAVPAVVKPVTGSAINSAINSAISANPVTLLELCWHHCRWPVEAPGKPMMYCGAAACAGSSWCAQHYRDAHVQRGRAA